jgi:hypothetical protein
MQDYLISRINSFSPDTKGLTPENLLERSKKDFYHTPGSKALVVCLPGGGHPLWGWKLVKRYVVKSGASFLTYYFPREILSDQQKLTLDCFEVINQTIRNDIKKMRVEHGFGRVVLVCLSLAGSFGSMVYKDNSLIDEIVLVSTGENLARDMWRGCRSQYLREAYERQGITEDDLLSLWANVSPDKNMPAHGTKVSIHLGESDRVALYEFSKTLVDILENQGFRPFFKSYPGWGHYFVSIKFLLFPKSFIDLTA